MILDQEVLIGVLIVGTFLTYLFIPTPNVIYKDQKTKDEILSFESTGGCFHMSTKEVKCPHNH